MALVLEAGKWYITEGDYLVFAEKLIEGSICSSIETSPGITTGGFTANQLFLDRHGWYYEADGKITGLADDWNKKLRIIAEYPKQLSLPEGYEWLGGFPKLYHAKDVIGKYIIRDDGTVINSGCFTSFFMSETSGIKRIGLVKKEATPIPNVQLAVGKWYVTAGDYLVNITGEKSGNFIASLETSPGVDIYGKPAKNIVPKGDGWYYQSNGEVFSRIDEKWVNDLKIVAEYPHPISLRDGFEWKNGFPKLYVSKELDYYHSTYASCFKNDNKDVDFSDYHGIGRKRIGLVKVNKPVESPVPVPVPIVESKEEEMKKETAIKIAGVAGSLGFRALNYWFFEPAVNTFRPVVKGVRYAVFLGMITSSIYGYRNPEVVKNAIMSCLPKISVEAPEILK